MSTVRRGEIHSRIQMALRDLTARLHQLNDAVGNCVDLSGTDIEILDLVGRHGPMTPGTVSAMTDIHPATLTGILDRLERGGWLTRTPDPDDRRRVQLEARLDRGGELARLYAPMLRSINELCSGYTAEQLSIIAQFISDVAHAGAAAVQDVRTVD